MDDEIAASVADAARAFRALGARVERASPDMSAVPEIVALTRGFLMVARHAERVDKHRDDLQPGLVANTDQGLALGPRDVARGELLRTELWHRVQAFLATRDVWLTPTAAVPPFLQQPHELAADLAARRSRRRHRPGLRPSSPWPSPAPWSAPGRSGRPVRLRLQPQATALRAAAFQAGLDAVGGMFALVMERDTALV